MKNIADKADQFQLRNGIITEDLTPPIATFALALVDRDGNVVENGTTGKTDGLTKLRVARATFDPGSKVAHRSIAAHGLGVTLPSGAIVVGGLVQVATLLDSADHSGSVAISIQSANDIISVAAISGAPFSTTGLKAIVPKANTPESTGIALTAAREVTATVTTTALTAGKLTVFLYYLRGN